MEIFEIEITETLSRIIEIEADSMEDALRTARTKYRNEEIVLDNNDYVDTVINIFNE